MDEYIFRFKFCRAVMATDVLLFVFLALTRRNL